MTSLGEAITRKSSLQTYITFKLLADKALTQNSYRGYAYFRWVDDEIDVRLNSKKDRIEFINRQKQIINNAYENRSVSNLAPEEKLIVDLIATNRNKTSKLHSFIYNFVRIIEFDASRKDKRITKKELNWYSEILAIAVIDCIEYFINHDYIYPDSANQYKAAVAAHITHMLRDYYEDLDEGFINIPEEYLLSHNIKPEDVQTEAFRDWVKSQVNLARKYFRQGMTYWKNLPVLRGKLAAFWYCTRFEKVLDMIENDRYILRHDYPRKNNPGSYIKILLVGLKVVIIHFIRKFNITT